MKYEVGQKVKIRSLEWYRDNVNRYGIIECGKYEFFEPMNEYCGKVVTIKRIDDDNYRIDADKGAFCWADEMIEGLAEELVLSTPNIIMDGERGRLVVKPVYQPKRDSLYQECLDAVPEEIKEMVSLEVEFSNFVSLVKRMREAQMDKDILEMRLRFKIDQDEKISEEDNAEFATAMCNVVFYEDKVDEYLKKMEE